MKRKPTYLVIIEWGDAWSGSHWVDLNHDVARASKIISVGYLMEENKDGYLITGRVDRDNNDVGNRSFIPRGMVQKITRLKKLKAYTPAEK